MLVAVVITDSRAEYRGRRPVLVVHQDNAILDGMDDWNKNTHGRSGLIDQVKASVLSDAQVEAQMISFLQECCAVWGEPDVWQFHLPGSPFLARWMPRPSPYFHYRNLDVSTLKELVNAGSRRLPGSEETRQTRAWPIFMNRSKS